MIFEKVQEMWKSKRGGVWFKISQKGKNPDTDVLLDILTKHLKSNYYTFPFFFIILASGIYLRNERLSKHLNIN